MMQIIEISSDDSINQYPPHIIIVVVYIFICLYFYMLISLYVYILYLSCQHKHVYNRKK